MPSPAQGLFKQTIYGKQVALGTPKTGAGGQILRRRTSVFTATRDSTTVDEIVSHRQDTGVVFGQKKSGGRIDGALSPGTYAPLIGSALMKDFVVVAPYAAGADVTAAVGPPGTFTEVSAGYLTAGLKVGLVGRWTGWTTGGAANNSRNFWITGLTAGVMTGIFLDGTPVAAKAAGDTVTFTVVGKISLAPLTGHTNDFYTFEEWYADRVRSEVYPDSKINRIDLSIPAAGAGGISIDVVGLGTRTLAGAQSFTAPAVETLTGVVQALQGAIYVNGALLQHVTSLTLTIDRGLAPVGASIGSAISPDFNQGTVKVSGSFTAMFSSEAVQVIFDALSKISIAAVACVDGTPTSEFVGFTMGKVAITSDTPDDGLKAIMRTYAFTAEINGAGGALLAFDQTILTVQDSAA